jgi:integrase
MKVEDFRQCGKGYVFRFREKGGKVLTLPAHPKSVALVEDYLAAAGIGGDKRSPLFRAMPNPAIAVSPNQLLRENVFCMVRRRCENVGLHGVSPHSLRATGITLFLANGGRIETAAHVAGHASPRTTQLYNRSNEDLQTEIRRVHRWSNWG